MIKLHNINKIYRTVNSLGCHAVNDCNLYFEAGEFVAITGDSGCGKTTLLNLIGGIDTPTSGEMAIDGKLITKFTEEESDSFRNHNIGFIFQDYNLINHLTVLENVMLKVRISGCKKTEARDLAADMLNKVGLKNHMHKKPNQLSGGERQRVAIARALVNSPKIILADEPTGALDKKNGLQIMELLKELSKDKLVIMVTHNLKLASSFATREIKMKDGRVISDSNDTDSKVKIDIKYKPNLSKLKSTDAYKMSFKNLFSRKISSLLISSGLAIGLGLILLISCAFTSVRELAASNEKSFLTSDAMAISKNTDEIITAEEIEAEKNYLFDSGYFSDVVLMPSSSDLLFSITSVEANNEFVELDREQSLLPFYTLLPVCSNMESLGSEILFDGIMPLEDDEIVIPYDIALEILSSKREYTDQQVWEKLKNRKIIITSSSYLEDDGIVENIDQSYEIVGIFSRYGASESVLTKNAMETYAREASSRTFLAIVKEEFVAQKLSIGDAFSDDGYIATIIAKNSMAGDIEDVFNDFSLSAVEFILNVISYVVLITAVLMLVLLLSVSVFQRKREIGLLRSIGASRGDVKRIFILETTLIGLFASLISILGIVIMTLLVNWIIPTFFRNEFRNLLPFLNADRPLAFNISSYIFVIILGFVVSLIAGFLPASKAAKKNPVEALRNE